MEKYFGFAVGAFVVSVLALLIGSSYGLHMFMGTNYLADNANAAIWYYKIGGTVCFLAAGYLFSLLQKDEIEISIGAIMGVAALIGIGVCVNCGFNFAIG